MTQVEMRWTGPVALLSAEDRRALYDRSTSNDDQVRTATAAIIARVRLEGDMALRSMAREFDQVDLMALEVPRTAWQAALEGLTPDLRRVMERAAANIRAVHTAFVPKPIETESERGVRIGRRPDPLDRVGVYAPGGRAAYPSSVLMGAIPARVAGVGEVILCSPPGPNGQPSDVVLAAAALAEVDRVFAIGGAGAIAALAYGTDTVPRVDRIVGPGNAYVAEAKLQVSGAVAIDSPAGPSELLVVVDSSVSVEVIVHEVLAQAEHDPQASVVVVALGKELAQRVADEIGTLLLKEPRRDIIATALATRGAILEASTIEEAAAFSNAFAPEHLLLALTDGETVLPRFRNAGTIFVGETSSVAFGDYMSGANHVLPTGGLARSYSGLSTLDFIRWTTYQCIDQAAASSMANDVGCFADAEGLPAHAATARQWGTGNTNGERGSRGSQP